MAPAVEEVVLAMTRLAGRQELPEMADYTEAAVGVPLLEAHPVVARVATAVRASSSSPTLL
jgi:hypothetical protein